MISTVIFDLDGLLADTECLHRAAYQEVLAGLGVDVSDEQYADHWIRAGKGIDAFVSERNLAIDPALVRRSKARIYNELVSQGVDPMPGSRDLLGSLKGRKALAEKSLHRGRERHTTANRLWLANLRWPE